MAVTHHKDGGEMLRSNGLRRLAPIAAAMALVVALCAANASVSSAKAVTATAAKAACGVAGRGAAPADPEKVLAALPQTTKNYYYGFGNAVDKSYWSHFAPKRKKFVVGVSFNALSGPFNTGLYEALLASLKANKNISKVIAYTAATSTDIAGQIQQMQSLIQQKVNLIVELAAAGPPMVGVAKQAAKAGIPFVSLINYVPTSYAISVTPNIWQDVSEPTTSILNGIGKTGNVLLVHGIPGTTTDSTSMDYFNQLVDACPNVTIAGSITGDYTPPVVASAALQFLSTHPQPIAAVLQVGTMSSAIMQAFQQVGRPMPSVLDIGAQVGSVAYWHDNESNGYKGGGSAGGIGSLVSEATSVITRVLAGQGPKINAMVWYQPVITAKNLSLFYTPGTSLATQGTVDNPTSTYLPNSVLNSLFDHPSRKLQ
jgi:ribose transport system substrate-binding protein